MNKPVSLKSNAVNQFTATALVVDDETTNRKILSRILQRIGLKTREAANGQEAIDIALGEAVDIVLLDIVMPEMDGYEVLRRIREVKNQTELPVIMATSSSESEQIVKAFGEGANDYITKPFDVDVTLARVNTHMRLLSSQQALRKSEERYSLVAQATNDGLWDWDLIDDKVYFSPRWLDMLGLKDCFVANDLNVWLSRIHKDDRTQVEADIKAHLDGETQNLATELRMRHEDGGFRWMLCHGLAVRGENGQANRMAGSLTDITEGKVADALTGLPNRVLFMDRLDRCVDRKRRNLGCKYALIYIDLDNFKLVNDSKGHEDGDKLLVSVARRLEASVRIGESFVSRLGGDEFAILLEDIASTHEAVQVAKRVLDCLSKPFKIGSNCEIFVAASVGISVAQYEVIEPSDMIQQADTAMYSAKAQGKACYQVFEEDMRCRASRRLEIESELHRATEQKSFKLNYQPILDLKTGEIVSVEALIRWVHPDLGFVSPAEFIPISEDTGMIVQIGRWVLEEACRQLGEWQRKYPELQHAAVSVNLSSRQLQDGELVPRIKEILEEAEIQPQHLILEITETAIVKNPEMGANLLSQFRENGIKIAIDDFGTGYSSLAYLHRFPFDSLKIDRSFVDKINDSDESLAIIKTILNLADSLNLKVVAEGIETVEQQNKLRELDCDCVQGYYYARPIPPDEIAGTIAELQKYKVDFAHPVLEMSPEPLSVD